MARIQINRLVGKTEILIKNATSPIVKVALITGCLMMFFFAIENSSSVFDSDRIFYTQNLDLLPLTGFILLLVILVGMFYAAFKLLSRVFKSEIITVTDDKLILITKRLLIPIKRTFKIDQLGGFHFQWPIKKTDHPLKGKYIDAMGYDSMEYVHAVVNSSGNLYFDGTGEKIYFGIVVSSWDAVVIMNALKSAMGEKLLVGEDWDELTRDDIDYMQGVEEESVSQ